MPTGPSPTLDTASNATPDRAETPMTSPLDKSPQGNVILAVVAAEAQDNRASPARRACHVACSIRSHSGIPGPQ